MNRSDAPLRPAEDAVVVDTSDLTIEQAVAQDGGRDRSRPTTQAPMTQTVAPYRSGGRP